MPQYMTETFLNGHTALYKIVNGTAYYHNTPDKVVDILEEARQSIRKTRVRLCYGDSTGRDWNEVHDTTGYVGRSTGRIKIPILISHSDSREGPSILDHCIVRIERKRKGESNYVEVYRHPHYHKEN